MIDCKAKFESLRSELHKVIVGQEALLERLLVALLADGHVLLEGVPGLAKTKTLTTLTRCIHAQMQRIQFTPDLLPADLVGTEIYRPQTSEFVVRRGPIFTNLLLADEINRAPAKVQSALLQSMQEREVTIGEQTFPLPTPFMVLATQNPIEQEGTFPLPEAQVDRFLLKVRVSYPSLNDEIAIIQQVSGGAPDPEVSPVMDLRELLAMRDELRKIFVDPKLDRYIVTLIHATRAADAFGLQGMVEWGASPRGSIALRGAAQALALIRGKSYVTPDEIRDMALDTLRHRIVPSFEAEARGITSDTIITTLLKEVTAP